MPIETLVFDLDDTLYPQSCGLMSAIGQRIQSYVERVTGLPAEEAFTTRRGYLARFGTTWRGLQDNYSLDLEDYMRFVHDVDYNAHLCANLPLDEMLGRLPRRKIIFTNSIREHSEAVLDVLGIGHHFDLILDVRAFDYAPKPAEAAYQCLLRHLPHPPQAALYLDDRLDNLLPAARLGLTTVLVAENGRPAEATCESISNILELERLLTAGHSLALNGHNQPGL